MVLKKKKMIKKNTRKIVTATAVFMAFVFVINLIPAFSLTAYAVDEKGRAVGVDVSAYNGTIDWEKAKADGIDFAIIRIGYGDDLVSQDDGKALENIRACERLGIPYGVYIYSYALTTNEVYSEARHLLRVIEGHDPALGCWFDMEDADGYKARNGVGIETNGQLCTEMCILFCNLMKQAGIKIYGTYSAYSWFKKYLDYDAIKQAGLIWLAQWLSVVTDPGMECDMWQWASDGNVDGIGQSDMDYIYASSVLSAYLGTLTNLVPVLDTIETEGTGIKISWSKAGEEFGISGFNIYRRKANGTKWEQVGTTDNAETLTFTDNTDSLIPSTKYYYSVQAYKNGVGNDITYSGFNQTGTGLTAPAAVIDLGEGITATRGDVNSDGVINALDYVIVKNHILNKKVIPDTDIAKLTAADANGDGKIDAVDYVRIKNIFLSNLK